MVQFTLFKKHEKSPFNNRDYMEDTELRNHI